MQKEQYKFQPYKMDNKLPVREFEILENGDVKMIEKTESVVWFHGREFISFYREHVDTKEKLEKSISEEAIKKIKEDIEETNKGIAKLDKFIPEVEKRMKENYEKMMVENKTKAIKEEIAKKKEDRKPRYLEAIWRSSKEEQRKKILEKLTPEEKKEIAQLKVAEKKATR